mmetsp:Transcript_69696/g.167303  ORF Transcript_69696/g.167303 Transcript_69696/m.167303 type:complete len:384 (+) Transcript_69696:97-1248(+)
MPQQKCYRTLWVLLLCGGAASFSLGELSEPTAQQRQALATLEADLASVDQDVEQSDTEVNNSNTVLPWGPAWCFTQPTWLTQEVQVKRNIKYGSALNYFTRKYQDLHLDAYFPPAKDPRQERPAILLIHGGSFTSGNKSSDGVPALARSLAARGFVAVSIDYRLLPKELVLLDLTHAGPKLATTDARAAVRFLRKQAKLWRIDPTRIAVGGDSAGAIASLYYAVIPPAASSAGLSNAGFSSGISGVISISGAAKAQAFCSRIDENLLPHRCLLKSPPGVDDTQKLVAGDVPILLLHGTADTIIPYINAVKGTERATEVGVRHELITIPNAGHVPLDQILDPKKPYLEWMMVFIGGMLDLAHSECPSRRSDDGSVAESQETLVV